MRRPRQVGRLHGTTSNYTNGGCRCDLCTWAWSAYRRRQRDGSPPDGLIPAPAWFDSWAESMAGSL